MPASSAEAVQYEQGRKLAIELLGNAKDLDEASAALAKEAAQHLALAKLLVAADAEADRQCAQVGASLFVLQTVPNTIFICADARWHVQNEVGPVTEILAQGFIHEGAHLVGETGECIATILEMEVTANSIGVTGLGNFNKYSGQCDGFQDAQKSRRHKRRPSLR